MYHQESVKLKNSLIESLDELKGFIQFQMGGITVDIADKDCVGNILEEWINSWIISKGFNIHRTDRGQEFPDYYTNDNHMIEIKTYNSKSSPNFDLANFESYYNSIRNIPERVDSDYIIISYLMDENGLSIIDVYLKKIWEITCPSERWPVKTQTKRGMIYALRPGNWTAKNPRYKIFNDKETFIESVNKTYNMYKELS